MRRVRRGAGRGRCHRRAVGDRAVVGEGGPAGGGRHGPEPGEGDEAAAVDPAATAPGGGEEEVVAAAAAAEGDVGGGGGRAKVVGRARAQRVRRAPRR